MTPKWLKFLTRRLGWLAIPNIAILLVTLQVLGFVFVLADPAWLERLALVPGLVQAGQVWRLLTFLAVPLTLSPIWLLFSLYFLYFTVNLIESEWGAFQTTLYVLVSVVLTIVFSLLFDFPVTGVQDFTSTLFLAAAALYPNLEVRLYFAIPVKMKFLGWLALAFLALKLAQADWLGRLYLLTIYSNYLIFFGPALVASLKAWHRRTQYRRRFR